ncbi:MAG: putative 4-hydroxy-4-methyl-2-oxoglutarate aldolase, partial [Halomonadaceae bacterium]
MSQIITPDLCDKYPEVDVIAPLFLNFGGIKAFAGPVRTVTCFEDNSMVKQAVNEPGDG